MSKKKYSIIVGAAKIIEKEKESGKVGSVVS